LFPSRLNEQRVSDAPDPRPLNLLPSQILKNSFQPSAFGFFLLEAGNLALREKS